MTDEEVSFALGQGGSTRKKIAKASGCVLEYVGNFAYMAGSLAERRRCGEYLSWLLMQRVARVYLRDRATREDASILEISARTHAEINGLKSLRIRDAEEEAGVFCVIEGDVATSCTLLVCSGDEKSRTAGVAALQAQLGGA